MRKLYEFELDCGRMGSLTGRFVLDEEGQKQLEESYGKVVYFGEVLGKHSDVQVKLAPNQFTVVTDNQEFLNMAARLGVSLNSGYNPFHYMER